MKALLCTVARQVSNYDLTNGGITATHDQVLLACDKGPFDSDDHPDLPLLDIGYRLGYLYAYPVDGSPDPEKTCGPMFGGNFVHTSDSRFARMLEEIADIHVWSGALPVHDRWETPDQYEALSR